MKELPLKSISAHKLRIYLICPRRYYYAYAEGIFPEKTREMVFGSFIHEVLEDYIKHLLRTRRQQDMEGLLGLVLARKKNYSEISETGDHSFFEADIILNRFAAGKINPNRIYAVEKAFSIPFPGQEDISLEGRIDRIDLDTAQEQERILHIIDYKTGKGRLSEEQMKEDLQVRFYITAAHLLYRRLFRKFRFSFMYLNDNTDITAEIPFSEDMQRYIGDQITLIRNDRELPKKTGRHCLHCPAFDLCKPDIRT